MIDIALLPAAALLAASPQQQPAVTPAPAPPAVEAEAPPLEPAASRARTPGDPHEKFNRRMYKVQQDLDRAIIRPAALGYRHVVPKPVRTGLRHAFSNLQEPIVFLNYLLQLKPGKAIETATRFLINSTLGLGGVLDLAKTPGIKLPHRPNGFGDTLGFYGVKPGAYLYLPLIGPTDFRDLVGGQADGLVLPLAVGGELRRNRFQIPRAVIAGLDLRAESDEDLKTLLEDSVDPYATLRSVYLQDRAGEIAALKGKSAAESPLGELQDPLRDPAAGKVPELQDPLTDPAAAAPPPKPSASSGPELDDPLADPAASPTPRPGDPPRQPLGGPEAPRK